MDNSLYKKIEHHVTGLFETSQDEVLVFHNLEHTQHVVERTKEIAGHYNVSEKEMLILFTAAWFHDTGYLYTEPSRHEIVSVEVMRRFMLDHTNDMELIQQIEECIMATQSPRNPTTLLQQIICDADTYNLGTKEFKATNKKVREELALKYGQTDKLEFSRNTIKMLETHQYYTTYCKDQLSATKELNMKKLKKKIEEKEREKEKQKEEARNDSTAEHSLADIEKDKTGLMSKGIQTMLRLTSENHLKLSDMADQKANILITVNAIIISVILSVLLRKLQEEPHLTIPAIIFLLTAVVTIVLSILATRPKISGGTFSHQDILDKKVNLLFFGNFHRASFDQYNNAMRSMMRDTDYLYGSLIKDIYYLGAVLGRKYKLIRLAYNVFMIGIIISVIAFALASVFHQDVTTGPTILNNSGSPL